MILRRTQSLCPICLRRIEAFYKRVKKSESGWQGVILHKECPTHGVFEVPAWAEVYGDSLSFESWFRPKTPSYPVMPGTQSAHGCPFDCGLCPLHAQHTCTGLVEITRRCNMKCPVCYAGTGDGQIGADPPLESIASRLDSLGMAAGNCNIQISGGEPTVRDDLPAILSMVRERNFGLLQLNTNGLRLGQEPGYAATLRACGLDSVYLQWDGVDEKVMHALRGMSCLQLKHRAVAACAKAGLGVVLVATLVRHVNDGHLGSLLRMALEMGSTVRGIHFQPAASFGRYPWSPDRAPRLTLPEVMSLLARQAPDLVQASHFHPPGCEHELCSFSAVYRRYGPAGIHLEWLPQADTCCSPIPLQASEGAQQARRFVALHWKGRDEMVLPQADRIPDANAFNRFLHRAGAEPRFTISAMAFQDAGSVDLQRTRGCCIHVVQEDGRLVPFCLHNLTAHDGTHLHR